MGPIRTKKERTSRRRTEDRKKWDEVCCPICMEQPHNAVLLKCSSHEKGCRPYMCDTDRRHSNCLQQFLNSYSSTSGPTCPLCRGTIHGYFASYSARAILDLRPRSCSAEGCGFTGSYSELRRHSWSDHPSTQPTEVDPDRQLAWTRLGRETDLGDVFSLVQPSNEVAAAIGSNNRDVPQVSWATIGQSMPMYLAVGDGMGQLPSSSSPTHSFSSQCPDCGDFNPYSSPTLFFPSYCLQCGSIHA